MSEADTGSGAFSRDFAARVNHVPIRQLAKKSGWGRTTVNDLVAGKRLPTLVQLEHLLIAADVEPPEIEQWRSRLSTLLPVETRQRNRGDPDEPSNTAAVLTAEGTTGASMRWGRRWWPWLAGTMAIAVLVGAFGFAIGRGRGGTGGPLRVHPSDGRSVGRSSTRE